MRNHQIAGTLLAGLLTLGSYGANAASAPAARCNSITGGGAKVTSQIEPGCRNCSVEAPHAAADDHAETFASLKVFSLNGVLLRATAQRGIVYPAGGRAGVFYSLPNNDPKGDNLDEGGSWGFGIRTYLSGKLQESGSLKDFYNFPGGDTRANRYAYVETTKPYDAVELYISDAQVRIGRHARVGSEPYKVYEICSDGDVSEYPER